MKSIHAACRRQFNRSKNRDFLDINLNVEKISCGLVEFNLKLLTIVNTFN